MLRVASLFAALLSAGAPATGGPEANAPAAVGLRVLAEEPLILGALTSVELELTVPEGPETEGRPLRVSANVGSFGEVTPAEPGVYRVTYALPETRFPQVALIAVWRETGPDAEIAVLRLPLFGKTELPITTRPNAEVRVLVGDTTFGPVRADARGRAKVPLVVPPGLLEVVVTSSSDKHQSQATVATGVPPYNRLTLAVTPYLAASDGASPITAHVYYDTGDGPPPAPEAVRLEAPGGQVTLLGAEGSRYRFRYVPERSATAKSARLVATVAKDRVSRAEATVELGRPVPERILLRGVEGELLADGASTARVRVVVLDRLGLGVTALAITATVTGGAITGQRDAGEGFYELILRGPAALPPARRISLELDTEGVAARFDVPVRPAPWPVQARFETRPAAPVADGQSAFAVRIAAFDQAGDPFDGARFALTASAAAVLPVRSLGGGVYEAEVVAPRGLDALTLDLLEPAGQLTASHLVRLRPPPRVATLGLRAGLARQAIFGPALAIEGALRPGVLDHRLRLFTTLEYRRAGQRFPSPLAVVGAPELETRLQLLTGALGGTWDLFANEHLALYAGGAVTASGWSHRVLDARLGVPARRGLALGGELFGGVELSGFFFELGAAIAPLQGEDLRITPLVFGARVGYRLGLL